MLGILGQIGEGLGLGGRGGRGWCRDPLGYEPDGGIDQTRDTMPDMAGQFTGERQNPALAPVQAGFRGGADLKQGLAEGLPVRIGEFHADGPVGQAGFFPKPGQIGIEIGANFAIRMTGGVTRVGEGALDAEMLEDAQ